ncbi:hypothetical protein [Natrinema sp. 1APR25-10V2]|uniref:hypothetical protein n=1 Tax=Natrinema sp. 1APR25-10V2 TaxID=2951081 RepID=UPI00287587CE|nr:hypothetical protein [Natrinema sp. 1APR25-10V2]MDS0477911.1 hypothetical protein [Natrinema sp. 1APR25-10V2]
MTDRVYPCPSSDHCEFEADSAAALVEHVNTEHAGEYRRDDWPDTAAGRAVRTGADKDEGNEDDESKVPE